ncbi:diphthine synthase [Methanomicrobiaceae archaeon CYW5]|uniref:diphthine synthase n=1 Tax=Methanovulcanius yangii TaxID=1789227 RepID=UPI0029CA20DA|nr:diphthine synthase [Methanovulcanius yangii]MBT8507499.1 diphthine synthase [Methanovulcanius yangii]
MLSFIGLGLFDGDDISLKGLKRIQAADHVFLEGYTSRLMGIKICEMEDLYGKTVTVLGREDVELHPDTILEYARDSDVAFLTGGDPMVSTTHADLRIRASERGIPTEIVHGSSISSAVCGLSGLQNYRFGKSCSIPFPAKGWFPTAPLDTILANQLRSLHTIVYLDIQEGRYMTVPQAIRLIEEMAVKEGKEPPRLFVGIARAGSADPHVRAGDAQTLRDHDFGDPLHVLVIPAELHLIEEEYLKTFAGL